MIDEEEMTIKEYYNLELGMQKNLISWINRCRQSEKCFLILRKKIL